MAEQSGKGIALVILGIVAIIAIVGLVLLFTGYKGAAGKFAVPASKEYGGAIQGIYDPYSRAFAGRAFEFPQSGQTEHYSAQSVGRGGVAAGGQAFGDVAGYGQSIGRGEQYQVAKTFERAPTETPARMSTCTYLSRQTNQGDRFSEPASSQQVTQYESLGRNCKSTSELVSVLEQVNPDEYGRARELYGSFDSIGVKYCCESAGLALV